MSEINPLVDKALLDVLVCPFNGDKLTPQGNYLVSSDGRRYPVVEGVPVLLREDLAQTLDVIQVSIEEANRWASGDHTDSLFLRTIAATDDERNKALQLHQSGTVYDPVFSVMIAATTGNAYKPLRGRVLDQYPIPDLRFPDAQKAPYLISVATGVAGASPPRASVTM